MKAEKVEIIDVDGKVDDVDVNGPDIDMYENALDSLCALQHRYNNLVEQYNALLDQVSK